MKLQIQKRLALCRSSAVAWQIARLSLFVWALPANAYGPGCPRCMPEPAVLSSAHPLIEIPMKWCAIAQAPSILDPSLVCESTFKDFLWRRHERASDCVWIPQGRITMRSGAVGGSANFKSFDDLDISIGQPGDIVADFAGNFDDELHRTWEHCAAAWGANPLGVVAVSVRAIIDRDGKNIANGIAYSCSSDPSMTKPYLAVADPQILVTNVGDIRFLRNERTLAHELGHVLGLCHNDMPGNLLSTNAVRGATLTFEQCTQAGSVATSILTANPELRTSVVLDQPDSPSIALPFMDVAKVIAIDNPECNVFFCLGTRGIVPKTEELSFCVLLDADGDESTGATPDVPGASMEGVDLICEVFQHADGELEATLYQYDGSQFFVSLPVMATPQIRDVDLVICEPAPWYEGGPDPV